MKQLVKKDILKLLVCEVYLVSFFETIGYLCKAKLTDREWYVTSLQLIANKLITQ